MTGIYVAITIFVSTATFWAGYYLDYYLQRPKRRAEFEEHRKLMEEGMKKLEELNELEHARLVRAEDFRKELQDLVLRAQASGMPVGTTLIANGYGARN